MFKIRQRFLLASVTILAAFAFVAPASSSTPHQDKIPKVQVTIEDTGSTVALGMGQDLVITLPTGNYDDNYWYVAKNTGAPLRLIAGPNELRRKGWAPWHRYTIQVFYFRREAPGTAHLVLEQAYWSKPMILKVIDH